MMKVSILIPTYNQENYIEQCIESALSQTYNNLEIIISDDCSTDETSNICKRYLTDQRVKYYRNSKNIGRVKNYQKLLYQYSSGDWAINIDGDDYLVNSDFILIAIESATDEDVIISAKRAVEKNGKNSEQSSNEFNKKVNGYDVFLNWKRPYELFHVSSLYKVKKAQQVGFYQDDMISSDRVSIWKLLSKGNVNFLPIVSSVWRDVNNSQSKTIDIDSIINNSKSVDVAYEFWVANSKLTKEVLKRWLTYNRSVYFYDHLSLIIKISSYKNYCKLLYAIFSVSKKTFFSMSFHPKLIVKLIIKPFL